MAPCPTGEVIAGPARVTGVRDVDSSPGQSSHAWEVSVAMPVTNRTSAPVYVGGAYVDLATTGPSAHDTQVPVYGPGDLAPGQTVEWAGKTSWVMSDTPPTAAGVDLSATTAFWKGEWAGRWRDCGHPTVTHR
jgi:hypothetical protein